MSELLQQMAGEDQYIYFHIVFIDFVVRFDIILNISSLLCSEIYLGVVANGLSKLGRPCWTFCYENFRVA